MEQFDGLSWKEYLPIFALGFMLSAIFVFAMYEAVMSEIAIYKRQRERERRNGEG